MKLALLGLCLLPLAALRSAPQAVSSRAVKAPLDDPIECPLCGGNVELHAQIVTYFTLSQAQIAQQALASGWY